MLVAQADAARPLWMSSSLARGVIFSVPPAAAVMSSAPSLLGLEAPPHHAQTDPHMNPILQHTLQSIKQHQQALLANTLPPSPTPSTMWRHLVWGIAVTAALVAQVPVSMAQDPPVQNSGSAYTAPYSYPLVLLAYKDKIFSAGKS